MEQTEFNSIIFTDTLADYASMKYADCVLHILCRQGSMSFALHDTRYNIAAGDYVILINVMSKSIRAKGLKGFSPMALRTYRTLEEYPISPDILLSRLSFGHFVELIRKEDPLERLFYEVESIKNNWGVRELERAMDTALYVRTGLSRNKGAVIAKFKNQKPAQSLDIIRDPYFLEFLGLEERSEYSESELEQAILDHLQKFLIEPGTGFCFEARQNELLLTIHITAFYTATQ